MHSLSKNLLAALTGQAGRALVTLVVVPLYLPLLGAEAFGLVGFHGALMAVLALIDGGLGVAANREVARRKEDPATRDTIRTFVRTLEWVYWLVGCALAAVCLALSSWLAYAWLTPRELTVEITAQCLAALGASVALRWPSALYYGILTGAQRLVFLNGLSLAVGIGYGLGGYLVLRFVSSSPLAFFQWQLVLGVLEVGVLAWYTWKVLPLSDRPPRFDPGELRGIRKFAFGNGLLALVTIGLTNSDRLLLGKAMPLQSLGYYSIATQVNGLVSRVGGIFYSLYLPRFSQLSTQSDTGPLRDEFRRGLQLMSILVFPLYTLAIVLMPDLLQWWLRDSSLAAATAGAAQWLLAGSAFNAIVLLPHTLLLAHGITGFAIRQNIVALLVYLPLLYFLIHKYGIEGASMSWAALNIGYYLISPPLMLRHVFKGLHWGYVYRLTAPAILLSASLFGTGYFLRDNGPLIHGVGVSAMGSMVLLCLAAATPWVRHHLVSMVQRGRADPL